MQLTFLIRITLASEIIFALSAYQFNKGQYVKYF